MAVAATAMIVAPPNWMKGIADNNPMAMQDPTGVCHRGFTFASTLETGSWSSRAIPKHSRMVEVMIARQQMKMAAATTTRYVVARALFRLASMIVCGPNSPVTAFFRSGMAISVPHKKKAPMMNAPVIEARTALGASLLGSRVSSARVDAVSNPYTTNRLMNMP